MIRAELHVIADTYHHEWAHCYLYHGRRLDEWIDVEYTPFLDVIGTGRRSTIAHDLLLLAAGVYALDKHASRANTRDGWTRHFHLLWPINHEQSANATAALEACLAFLTGDRWTLMPQLRTFRRSKPMVKPRRYRRGRWARDAKAVSLFSGGLDSLIGIINWLEEHDGRIVLVSHHDGDVPGPLADQHRLLVGLQAAYPRRIKAVLSRIGMFVPHGGETTFRSRSFLFLAMALQAYAAIAPASPILMPENGGIAYNLALTPSRLGSCSTRTSHPTFLALFDRCVRALADGHDLILRHQSTPMVVNPLQSLTKGEAIATCRNPTLLRQLYLDSVSCGKRSHRATWVNRQATHCGRDWPCFIRRGALHRVGWDDEVYGTDICRIVLPKRGEPDDALADLRALLWTLTERHTPADIAQMLMNTGTLTVHQVREGTSVVWRTLAEVRTWLHEKASVRFLQSADLLPSSKRTRARL